MTDSDEHRVAAVYIATKSVANMIFLLLIPHFKLLKQAALGKFINPSCCITLGNLVVNTIVLGK